MPRVPYAPRPDVIAAPYQGAAPADTTAKYRGQMALAQGIGAAGDAMQRFALQSQQIQNEAALARGRLAMDKAQEDFRTWQQSPEGADEAKWGEEFERRAEQVEREAFADAAPVVQRTLRNQFDAWSQTNRTEINGQVQRRQNDKALAAMVDSAEARMRAQDWQGAVATIDRAASLGLLTPAAHREQVQRVLDYGGYYNAVKSFNAIKELPLRDQVENLEQFERDLLAQNADGKYANFEYDRGGMSARGRIEMAAEVSAQMRRVQRQMDVNAYHLTRDLISGEATIADVGRAWDDGQIGVDAMAPEFARALQIRAQKEAQREAAAVGRLERDLFETGEGGFADIDERVRRGEITPARAQAIRERLAAQASVEESLPDFRDIADRLDAWYARKVFATSPAESARGQPEPAEYRAIAAEITDPRLPISQPARLELMKRLFEAKIADISELEEEKDGKWTWIDRDISRPEAALRVELITQYRDLLPELGAQNAGALLFSQERRIVDLFSRGEPPSAQEVQQLRAALTAEAQAMAGDRLLREAFGN